MAIHTTSVNGMGASTLSGSTITNTGMGAEDHMHFSQDYVAASGVVKDNDCLVTQNGTPNMTVLVAAGTIYIPNVNYPSAGNSVTQQRFWRAINDASYSVSINSNGAGNPRITSIFAKFNAGATPDSTASNVTTFVAVDGTAAASPTAPSAPADGNSYERIANVTVASGATSITNANITDTRIKATLTTEFGWEPITQAATYQAADAPSFTLRFASVDMTGKLSVGMKMRLKQGGSYKYFIITAISFSTNTDVNLYGGTDYTLANSAVTDVYYSSARAPYGFPASEDKWSVVTTFATVTQNPYVSTTFYQVGNLSIPIGKWRVRATGVIRAQRTGGTFQNILAGLSTATGSLSTTNWSRLSPSVSTDAFLPFNSENNLDLAAKTTYYFLMSGITDGTPGALNAYGSTNSALSDFRAICAYL